MPQAKVITIEDVKTGDYSEEYEKGVKHLSQRGITKVPSKYILPVLERPVAINGKCTQQPNLKLPVIDFADLHGPNRSQLLKSLACACEHYGFFQLVNHGIGSEIIREMIDVCGRFFEQALEEREKYMSSDMGSPVRYGTSFISQTKDGVFCWRDFLKLLVPPSPNNLSQEDDFLSLWPSSPFDFRELAVNYAKEAKKLFLIVVEAILESLGLTINNNNNNETIEEDEDDIMKEFENGSQLMVINCYPACPEPNLTLGMLPHSDYGFLTLLLQDQVPGLQIQFQDKWLTIQPIPNSFVVNVGDHLEIFSNGRYKSVLHRAFVNSTKSRISVASLHSVSFDSMVRPSVELVNETNPRRYMDTDFASFMEYLSSCDFKKKNFLESRKLTRS
ncbi:hypothetical protein LguiA_016047 [Lonicera macranthoides]